MYKWCDARGKQGTDGLNCYEVFGPCLSQEPSSRRGDLRVDTVDMDNEREPSEEDI